MSRGLTRRQLSELRSAPTSPNRLKLAMRLAGLTQVQLASRVQLNQSQISEIANGNYRRLPVSTASRLAAVFGCAIEDLFPAAHEAVA